MKRGLRVFGGSTFYQGRQVRTVVAASSQKAAASALHITLYEFQDWWAETGNRDELAAALASPGRVLQNIGDYTTPRFVPRLWGRMEAVSPGIREEPK